MKNLKHLFFSLLALVVICRANAQTSPAIAEAVTPRIQALADGLQHDPVRIFNYVHDKIRYVVNFGSKKGAELTLLEKSGNDFDQSALLVALLRAAGYTNSQWSNGGVGYQFGWQQIPYDNPDGSHRDIHHWFGLSLNNTNWNYTTSYLNVLLATRFFPLHQSVDNNNTYAFQRVWVTLTSGGTNYYLDPAFKVSEPVAGISLPQAMGSTASGISNALMSAAGGMVFGNPSTNYYVTNLSETAIRSTLKDYTTSLISYLNSNYPNASVYEVLGGERIVPANNAALSQTTLFPAVNMNGTMPVISWFNQPTNMMSTLGISFAGFNCNLFIPQLQGRRLSLTVSSSGAAQLWLDDTMLTNGTTGGGSDSSSLVLSAYHPTYNCGWDTANNVLIPSGPQATASASYQNANANYAILYSFEPDWGWLLERQKQLEAYQQQGLSSTSRQVVTETLNIMGLNWVLQDETTGRLLGQIIGTLPNHPHRMGRMAQESGRGYFVDVYYNLQATLSDGGSADGELADPFALRWANEGMIFSSDLESGMIEQLQSSNLIAASTIKMLQLANTNHQAVYLANKTNSTAVFSQLTGYNSGDLTSLMSQMNTLLLPQKGYNQIAGSSSWGGYGIMASFTGGGKMLIGEGLFGGYASDLNATVDTSWINYSAYSQPLFYNSAPASIPGLTGADPVNMADGTFQVEATDLTLGQAEPRGLSFTRYYNSSRRNSNLAGIAPGWVHNYYMRAALISAPQTGMGGSTPAQMAPMLTAITAANSLFNLQQPDPKNWLTTALIAKWGVDQLTAKAVSVSLGQDTLQFIQQPDGSYTPPANCTMTLIMTNAAYWLQERHGRTFKFNGKGWATNITDQYNQSLILAYNSSNLVQTVTDSTKNRSLTFTYHGIRSRLTQVADNLGRNVNLGYSSSNLVTVADPESKTNSFLYDTNHQITATVNALGQLVASNIYNSFGRVTTQYTQGDPNKTWKIFWSGWQTVSQDPAGGQTVYFYDDKIRLIAGQDALGNLSRKFYDGQDHVVMTVSPLGETNQFVYDGNNNLVQMIDPLGCSNQFVYDGKNNMVRAVDPLNHAQTFGYNEQFSMIGRTNGAGDWLNCAYNNDGTLATRTDAGGRISFGYDPTYGQLTSINYTNGLGSEGFANNALGDVTNHTDGRGFATAFQYNLRRELTNSIAPTNVMVRISRDAIGNVASMTDARGNTMSNSWSATRHLLKTTFPGTPQGTPTVTNGYDSRDWLTRSADPLNNLILYTNDLAGRPVSVTDQAKRTMTFGFDADGRKLAATNAALVATARQIFDARGGLLKSTDGAGHSSLGAYDLAGNQIFLTNRNNQVWQFQYDGANRLTKTITPKGRTTTLTFNHQGLVDTITDPANQLTSLFYDGKGRLTNRMDSVASTYFSFDANDNRTGVVENGKTNAWTFDAYNRVSTYRDTSGNLIQYRYDAGGNVTNLIYPGNRTVTYFYDSLNRLTNVTDWSGRKSSIAYDLASHIKSITRPNGSYRTIGYDAAGQATSILEQMSNSLPIAIFKQDWANSGSMDWEFAAPLPHVATMPTRTMTYDEDNRLASVNGSSVTSDLDGNLTYAPLTNGAFAAQTFDPRNRLSNVGGTSLTTNTYDALNNRIGIASGTNTTTFVVNPNAMLPQVLLRIKNGVTNYYIYGGGLLYQITETATATNTRTYHFDYRGSTIALSADSGLVTDRIEYSAYGLTTYRAGTSDTPFLFNGKYGVMTDPNGLLDMRARFYNPYLCRFVSSDPSGFGGGLNTFAYANGNPVSLVDPFGLGAIGENGVSSWMHDQILNSLTSGPSVADQLQSQNAAAAFVNFITLGGANLVSSATTGRDVYGNYMDVTDAYEQALQSAVVAASFIPIIGPESAAIGMTARAGETTMLAAETTTIDAASVRFSQSSISRNFSTGGTIDDLAAGLRNGSINPANIPPIRLIEQDGNLFSLDNRRLWSFQQAEVPVPYRMATPQEAAGEAWKFTTQSGGTSIRVRGQ